MTGREGGAALIGVCVAVLLAIVLHLTMHTRSDQPPAPVTPAPVTPSPGPDPRQFGIYEGFIGSDPYWRVAVYTYKPRAGRECCVTIGAQSTAIWCGSDKTEHE